MNRYYRYDVLLAGLKGMSNKVNVFDSLGNVDRLPRDHK